MVDDMGIAKGLEGPGTQAWEAMVASAEGSAHLDRGSGLGLGVGQGCRGSWRQSQR
jgi:hypothetical protein